MQRVDESHLLLDWFAQQGWQPFEFQREVWTAYQNGESGLIHAPTGTGKTYAAWLAPLMEWMRHNPPPYSLAKRNAAVPLTVIWLTPLRALATDTAEALSAPIRDLGLPWTVETRTGDTSSRIRNRQRTRLPSTLITTPESLSLLLSRENAPEIFKSLKAIIVDEWHELMASKRGVQVELALARLRRWNPNLRLWGLSATMGNLDVALETLLGESDFETGESPQGRLVRAHLPKARRIDAIIPESLDRFPWAGHLGLKLLPEVVKEIERSNSTLVFTNTRSQTEAWYQAILEAKPEYAGLIALHHSSLASETRHWVEKALKDGRLKCVVCTSSLDLGVDFAPVERVFQISSPKTVGRLLQRAGRSGHRPDAESRVTCVPAHAFELIEIAAVKEAVQEGVIEARPPIENPLDVLVQHLVTIALGGGFTSDDLYREVKTTHAYRHLTHDEWQWALNFVTTGGDALKSYEQYSRVVERAGRYVVESKFVAMTHRLSIGTILGDASLQVRYLKGEKIGNLEESFATRLKPGDRFTLAGKVLQFVRIQEMIVYVRRAKSIKGVIPRWTGGALPLSETLTHAVRHQLERARQGVYASPEMQALRPILAVQEAWSVIPDANQLLIERLQTREGHHLFFYPFEGRLVHEGLAALIAYRLSRLQAITFTMAANDYGFELLAPEAAPLEQALENGLLSVEGLYEDILASLNAAEMSRRQFREVARVAGLVLERYPGGQKTMKQLQASSGLLYDVIVKYDSDNRLLEQAEREVLQRQLESGRLHRALTRYSEGHVTVRDVKRPTPFAFPLLVERVRQTVSSESLEDRIRKMQISLEKWADKI